MYFDHASTSYPKPDSVADAVSNFIRYEGVNISRGSYQKANLVSEMVYDTRVLLADFFHAPKAQNVVFTANVTMSLNLLLKGFLRPGDHILVTALEHNAVMRPLTELTKLGITFDRIPCDEHGFLLTDTLSNLRKPNTRAILTTHASNVCGSVMPLATLSDFCKKNNLYFFVDCAQTAGILPIDMQTLSIDALCFTGHKALLGPQGIGGLLLSERLAEKLSPLISGGTGSFSHLEEMPVLLPDRLEAGTLNLPGIAGLKASVEYLSQIGLPALWEHEKKLTGLFLSGLSSVSGVRIVGPGPGISNRIGVISLQFQEKDQAEVCYELDSVYDIQTRAGLHCAPNAHKVLRTFPEGTVRFSIGYNHTEEDILTCIDAIKKITR